MVRTNRPDGHHKPKSCRKRRGSNLGRWSTMLKQNVDV